MGKTLEECYEILGLESGATEDEIKSAYRKQALKCHPDKNPDDPLSTQKFQELGHAYRRLTGEEDSDGDNDYEDDDMDLWRDFFFFLFRDEILARVRCKCYRCGRAGEHDEDDFWASLAKEQEERYNFTDEEMAQFTSFANLKEQREANKKKFCDERKQSNSKPEQKATKGNKPKLKSKKQIKLEQWKREKEISEIAAQINQTNPKVQGKKAFSKGAEAKDLHQQKSSVQPGVGDKEKVVKEQTEGGSNKRNARKKKNRNKSRQQSDKDTGANQSNGFMETTLAGQEVASTFVVQDAVRNVTIKPETTRRQDDVTGRLPCYSSYTSPRMMKPGAHVQESTMSGQKNVPQKQTGRGWFENQKPKSASRPIYGANIWQKRQEKQQFLAELQPCNQNDEELQLQMALELSRKQAEIDAQQREISLLEKQMEETFKIEKQFEQTTSEGKTESTAATGTGPDSFLPLRCDPASNEIEEWAVASESEDEWQESEQVSNLSGEYASNGNDNGFKIDEPSELLLKIKYCDLDEEHPSEGFASSGSKVSERDSMAVPKSNMQLPQLSGGQDSQGLDCCPYGKNCCLGKRCVYSHPPSIDNRKSQKFVENSSSSEDQCGHTITESSAKCNLACDLTEEAILPVVSCGELPDASDLSYPGDKTGQTCNALISDVDQSMTNQSLYPLQPEASMRHLPESDDMCTVQQSVYAADSVNHGNMTGVDATGFSQDSNSCNQTSGKLESLTQSLRNDITGLESQSSLEDRSLSSKEKLKSNNASDLQINSDGHLKTLNCDPGKVTKSAALCENSTTKEPSTSVSNATGPTVYVIADQSQFPLGLPAASALKQSMATLPPLLNLSPQNSQHSSSLPVNYARQMPTALPANLMAQTLTTIPQRSGAPVTIPQTMSGASQNSASPSSGETPQSAARQENTAVSSTSPQTGVTNGFPGVPGLPFLPYGNVFPFLNPANTAANASLLAAAASGIPFPIMPGPSNTVQNQQGGFVMNQPMLLPYLKPELGGGVSPLGQFLPTQAQLNGLSGMTVEGNVPVPRPPQPQPQPSQAGVTNNPQSTAPTVQQPLRLPFPFIDPQAFVNINAAMALGIPYSGLQNVGQTSFQSGLAPSQVQVKDKATQQCSVEHTAGTGVKKPAEIKRDFGEESGSVSSGSKTPSLRRPATVPKVIQHQASK